MGGRDHYAGGFGRFYAFYIERPWLAAAVGRHHSPSMTGHGVSQSVATLGGGGS